MYKYLLPIWLLLSNTSCGTVGVVSSKDCERLERGTPKLDKIYDQCVYGRNYCERLQRGNPKLEQIYEECLNREKVEEIILDSMRKTEDAARRGPF